MVNRYVSCIHTHIHTCIYTHAYTCIQFLCLQVFNAENLGNKKYTYIHTYIYIFKCTQTYESWAVKKAECWRINAFKLFCWRRLLRVPWTRKRSNYLILKESNPEYSLEGLMLKLKLQYFSHLMQRINSLEKTQMLGMIDGKEKRVTEDEIVRWNHWLNGHEFEQMFGDSGGQRSLGCCSSWGCRVGHDLATERQRTTHETEANIISWEFTRAIKISKLCIFNSFTVSPFEAIPQCL